MVRKSFIKGMILWLSLKRREVPREVQELGGWAYILDSRHRGTKIVGLKTTGPVPGSTGSSESIRQGRESVQGGLEGRLGVTRPLA